MRRWQWLAEQVLRNNWTRGAELGVKEGQTLFYLLDRCPDLHMTGVDLWAPQPDHPVDPFYGYTDWPHDEYEAKARQQAIAYPGRVKLFKMSTTSAALRVADESLHFCFVDGDHSHQGVAADLDAWLPKIKPGGWMTGHDWSPNHFPGVIQAVKERFGQPELFPDNVWAVRL